MANRQSGRSARTGGGSVVQTQAEIRDGIEFERQKRYTREYKQSVETEEALANLSKFAYEPADYVSALDRKQWVEPAIPDFSYLLTDARLKVTEKYFVTLVLQLCLGLFFVLLSLYFQDSLVALIGVVGLAACAFALHRELQSRRREIEKALDAAKAIIEDKLKEIREDIDTARKTFEDAENSRIERIEQLLAGEPAAVFTRMEEMLKNVRLPFYMRCGLDIYDNIPLLTLHLPGHNIVPDTLVKLSPGGNIEYEEKPSLDVNRQYTEAVAGTAVTLALLLLAYVPALEVVYVRGLLDRADEPDCLYSFAARRESAADVAGARSGLEALQFLGASFEIGDNGNFTHTSPEMPPWWDKTPRHSIRGDTIAFHPKV